MEIREYIEATDKEDVYRCIESIQDFERQFIPSMPKGVDIRVEYLNEAALSDHSPLIPPSNQPAAEPLQ